MKTVMRQHSVYHWVQDQRPRRSEDLRIPVSNGAVWPTRTPPKWTSSTVCGSPQSSELSWIKPERQKVTRNSSVVSYRPDQTHARRVFTYEITASGFITQTLLTQYYLLLQWFINEFIRFFTEYTGTLLSFRIKLCVFGWWVEVGLKPEWGVFYRRELNHFKFYQEPSRRVRVL